MCQYFSVSVLLELCYVSDRVAADHSMATEHLRCGWCEIGCAVIKKYTLDFKGLV